MALLQSSLSAQTLSGVVFDKKNREPVPYAHVYLDGNSLRIGDALPSDYNKPASPISPVSPSQVHDLDSELNKFIPFVHGFDQFSKNIAQEKVYLHFDNTSYYQGDNIWFKCYVTSAQNQLSKLSKTLYVELLNKVVLLLCRILQEGGIWYWALPKMEEGEEAFG